MRGAASIGIKHTGLCVISQPEGVKFIGDSGGTNKVSQLGRLEFISSGLNRSMSVSAGALRGTSSISLGLGQF